LRQKLGSHTQPDSQHSSADVTAAAASAAAALWVALAACHSTSAT